MSRRRSFERALVASAQGFVDWLDNEMSTTRVGMLDVSDLEDAVSGIRWWVKCLREEGLKNPAAGEYGVTSHDATDTQRAAACMPVKRGTLRWEILQHLALARMFNGERRGATDEELERATKRKHQTVSAARNHLMTHGWITDTGERREREGRTPVTVYDFTPLGWETYQALVTEPEEQP